MGGSVGAQVIGPPRVDGEKQKVGPVVFRERVGRPEKEREGEPTSPGHRARRAGALSPHSFSNVSLVVRVALRIRTQASTTADVVAPTRPVGTFPPATVGGDPGRKSRCPS